MRAGLSIPLRREEAPVSSHGGALWREWVVANAVGELLGLGAAAAVGWALASRLGEPQSLLLHILTALALIAAGTGEGIVVGCAQAWVIHRHLPELWRLDWVKATALGALVAWVFGMLPSTFLAAGAEVSGTAPAEPSQAMVLGFAALMGMVAGPILAFFQWRVLRRSVRGADGWILANAAAWALGMPLIFAGVDAAMASTTLGVRVLVTLVTLAGAGALVGAVHGLWLVRMVRESLASSPSG